MLSGRSFIEFFQNHLEDGSTVLCTCQTTKTKMIPKEKKIYSNNVVTVVVGHNFTDTQ
jgi:hypothetical protein